MKIILAYKLTYSLTWGHWRRARKRNELELESGEHPRGTVNTCTYFTGNIFGALKRVWLTRAKLETILLRSVAADHDTNLVS